MPITPPLDKIPALPAQGVSLLMKQVNLQVSKLINDINKLLESINKLSETTSCSDPKTKQAKDDLANVLNGITKIQPVITGLQLAVTTAQAIKAAQLLNPATAPAIISAELLLVQNMTIANSIQALTQLQQIPQILKDSLSGINLPLNDSLNTLSTICNVENTSYELPNELISTTPTQTIDSDFYNTFNVSDSDLDARLQLIQDLVAQQKDLLTSLEEAPSKVYEGETQPTPELGKPGDYFVDNKNRIIYGPKILRNEWPAGVNY